MSTARVVRRSVWTSKLFGIVLAEGSVEGCDAVESVLILEGDMGELDEVSTADDNGEAEGAGIGGEGLVPVVVAALERDVVGAAAVLSLLGVAVAWLDEASVDTVGSASGEVPVAPGGGELVPPYAHPSPSGIEGP